MEDGEDEQTDLFLDSIGFIQPLFPGSCPCMQAPLQAHGIWERTNPCPHIVHKCVWGGKGDSCVIKTWHWERTGRGRGRLCHFTKLDGKSVLEELIVKQMCQESELGSHVNTNSSPCRGNGRFKGPEAKYTWYI